MECSDGEISKDVVERPHQGFGVDIREIQINGSDKNLVKLLCKRPWIGSGVGERLAKSEDLRAKLFSLDGVFARDHDGRRDDDDAILFFADKGIEGNDTGTRWIAKLADNALHAAGAFLDIFDGGLSLL